MEVLFNGKTEELDYRDLKRGREAPAARVKKLDGNDDVIGMLAPEIQLLITLDSLDSDFGVDCYKNVSELSKKYKNVKTVFVLPKESFIDEQLRHEDIVGKFQIVFDNDNQFAKKFGIGFKNEALKNHLPTTVTIIELEGKIYYREVVKECTAVPCYKSIENNINAIIDGQKKSSHSHEDWMRY